MNDIPSYKKVLQSKGPAAGRISGINHLVMYSKDIAKSVVFYRDILGLKLVRTQTFSPSAMAAQSEEERHKGTLASGPAGEAPVRQVFFDMGDGSLFSLYEAAEVTDRPDAPIVPYLWPPANNQKVTRAQKLDHLAFDVPTRADLVWFQKHLRDNGVLVSEVIDRQSAHRFVISIYFSDPSNNPLEIATLDSGDPGWKGYDYSTWYRDENPPVEYLK